MEKDSLFLYNGKPIYENGSVKRSWVNFMETEEAPCDGGLMSCLAVEDNCDAPGGCLPETECGLRDSGSISDGVQEVEMDSERDKGRNGDQVMQGDVSKDDAVDSTCFAASQHGDNVTEAFYSWRDLYPQLKVLLDNFHIVYEELERLCDNRWQPWPETKLYDSEDQAGQWSVVPFMHTFPGWDPSRTRRIKRNCERCPETMKLINSIEGIRTVLFSKLGSGTRLSPHQGWADLSNYVLRVHLPVVLPDSARWPKSCGVCVDGEIRTYQEKEFIVFDDSKYHNAFNASDEDRVVLIFDIMRPDHIPLGTAVGSHTNELDDLISHYEASIEEQLPDKFYR